MYFPFIILEISNSAFEELKSKLISSSLEKYLVVKEVEYIVIGSLAFTCEPLSLEVEI